MKIAVLASGGVDSSVVLKLLQNQGHHVTAFYLKIWLEDELSFLGSCPWEDDLAYLRQICQEYNMPLEIVNFQKEYHQEVVGYALNEIKAGRTPNSDLLCNSKIKFGKFYQAISADYDLIASGHYADKLVLDNNNQSVNPISELALAPNTQHFLKKAQDSWKDQTYFLADLSHEQLKKAIFPLGPYLKSQVRALAQQFNLPNQSRKDSQGICFLGQIKYNEFVKYHLGEQAGDLINIDNGQVVGKHHGYWFFTIGQRKGIELSGGPWYVVKKDLLTNQVFISNHYHQNQEPRNSFEISNLHWITSMPSSDQMADLQVKVRHGEKLYPASLQSLSGNLFKVVIQGSDQGFAAGQFAVFYSGDLCLGVGTIN